MSVLDKIENKVSVFIETFFRRRIPHQIQPVEIGKALLVAMEKQKKVSVAKIYVPNRYTIIMKPEDLDGFQSMIKTLQAELKGVLHEKAEKDKLSFIGSIELDFDEDASLNSGAVKITAEFSENTSANNLTEGEWQDADTKTFYKKNGAIQEKYVKKAYISFADRQNDPGPIPLSDGLTVGRGSDCDLRLDDGNVSRIHARFLKKGGEWVVEDNGSTNGVFVNGEQVSIATLENGDRLQLGTVMLLYQES